MNAWSGVDKSAIVWYDGSMDTYGMSDETIIIGMLLLVCPLCLIPPLASGNLLYIVVASGIMVLSIFGGIAIIRYCARKRAVRVKDLARDPWIETEQNELGEQRYAVCVYELKSETNHYTHGSDTIDGCGTSSWSEQYEWCEVVQTIHATRQLAEQDLAQRLQAKQDDIIAKKRDTWY